LEVDEIRSLLTRDGLPNEPERVLQFRISNDNVDRYGSVLTIKGWDLKNYRDNPIFLYQHQKDCMSDSIQMPVGRSIKEWMVLPEYRTDKDYLRKNPISEDDGTGLYQAVFFPDIKESQAIFEAYNTKLLSTVSPGFKPTVMKVAKQFDEDDKRTGAKTFISLKQELFESSAVTLPGNTQAKQIRSAIDLGFKEEFLNVLGISPINERFGNIRGAVDSVNRSIEVIDQIVEMVRQTNASLEANSLKTSKILDEVVLRLGNIESENNSLRNSIDPLYALVKELRTNQPESKSDSNADVLIRKLDEFNARIKKV
jgi:hypothetical protein